jgi:predicted DNA-binding transcriptional regulator AlpA
MTRPTPPFLPRPESGATTFCYPASAMLRVKQITGTKSAPGLLPINASTWWDWVAKGKVPQGRKLGPHTTVWPLETVLAIARGEETQ